MFPRLSKNIKNANWGSCPGSRASRTKQQVMDSRFSGHDFEMEVLGQPQPGAFDRFLHRFQRNAGAVFAINSMPEYALCLAWMYFVNEVYHGGVVKKLCLLFDCELNPVPYPEQSLKPGETNVSLTKLRPSRSNTAAGYAHPIHKFRVVSGFWSPDQWPECTPQCAGLHCAFQPWRSPRQTLP